MLDGARFSVGLPCTWAPGAALGVMGGTFDPPHVGHLALARAAQRELGLDGMLYVPTGNPSFKLGQHVTPAVQRLEMLEAMLSGEPGACVSRSEVDRAGVTYSVDTLEELRRAWPTPARLVFVMGADSLRTLPRWRCAHRVLELAEVAVAGRAGEDLACDAAALRAFDPAARLHVLKAVVPEVSSTGVRAALARGGDAAGAVDPRVLAYIRAHGLYSRGAADGGEASHGEG